MGWPWSSTSPSAVPAPVQEKNVPIPSTPALEAPVTPQGDSSTPKPLSRDELAEQELQSFLKEIDADTHASSTKYIRVPKSLPPSAQTQVQTVTEPSTPQIPTPLGDESLSSQLLPTTMSCRTAFDAAFYCNSFGGRFNDLYRYGSVRSCSDSWSDFWFCMRTRTFPATQKSAAIKEHYRKKEEGKYSKALGRESSEDVWRTRESKLEWGEAFGEEYKEFEGSDEEWRELQREWRAKARAGKVDGSVVR